MLPLISNYEDVPMFKSIIKSIGYALLIIIFPIVAGAIISLNKIEDPKLVLSIQALVFFLASLLGILIYRRKDKIKSETVGLKKLVYFIPIIIVEALSLSQGVNTSLSFQDVLLYLIFTVFVGIAEEVFFRGLILQEASKHGKRFAVFLSALIFAISHLANLLDGANSYYTILQIAFAFGFGLVAALIVVLRESLIPVIVWHIIHNFLSLISADSQNIGVGVTKFQILISAIQVLILLIYAVYLFKLTKQMKLSKSQNL